MQHVSSQGVERMLDIIKVKAVLIRPISYQSVNGQEIVWPEGTEILVDPETSIALAGSDHFDISLNEYKVLFLN